MAQPSELYVDPSIAGDSGAGTVGDPYGDVEFAIEQTTFDTTNGTRVNIKAGTDEVLAANIDTALADTSVSIAWAPAAAAPLIFQGYTSVAGDGGKGGISGGGSLTILTSTRSHIAFIDIHPHNSGSADIINSSANVRLINCELNNTSGDACDMDKFCYIMGCYIHDIGGRGIFIERGQAKFNRLENGTKSFSSAIDLRGASGPNVAYRNTIKVDGTSDGIKSAADSVVEQNSIWSNGGTGQGILCSAANTVISSVKNNLVEGFSGTGGIGYDFSTSGIGIVEYGGNAAYDNATEYSDPNDYVIFRPGGASSNETLSASPFTDAANGDFSPIDTGSVKEGALPQTIGDE